MLPYTFELHPHFVLCVVVPGPVIPMTGGFFSAGLKITNNAISKIVVFYYKEHKNKGIVYILLQNIIQLSKQIINS